MIVCDNRKVIRYAHCGFTGSVNDSRVYKNSKLERHATDFFTGPEYLLSDSGYPCTKRIIAAYKKPPSRDLTFRVKKFNTLLSKIRVNVEICIGMLKRRFQSLRDLRINILTKQDHARAVFWFRCCVIFHNILVDDFYDARWTEETDRTEPTLYDDDSEQEENGIRKETGFADKF